MKYNATYLENYDADTVDFNIEIWPGITLYLDNARLYGIDAPEIRTSCKKEKALAIESRDYVKNKLENAKRIQIDPIEKGKYGRWLVRVYIDGKSLNQDLMNKGYAVKYNGGKRISWKEKLNASNK